MTATRVADDSPYVLQCKELGVKPLQAVQTALCVAPARPRPRIPPVTPVTRCPHPDERGHRALMLRMRCIGSRTQNMQRPSFPEPREAIHPCLAHTHASNSFCILFSPLSTLRLFNGVYSVVASCRAACIGDISNATSVLWSHFCKRQWQCMLFECPTDFGKSQLHCRISGGSVLKITADHALGSADVEAFTAAIAMSEVQELFLENLTMVRSLPEHGSMNRL